MNRKSMGIRIKDRKNQEQNVNLSTILSEINGKEFYWCILLLDAYGVGQDLTIANIQERAKRECGSFIRWDDLKFFATKLEIAINVTILCNKAVSAFQHYDNLQEECENCETVIRRIDDSYWEVFSKDAELIDSLAAKFQEVEHLDPRFMSN